MICTITVIIKNCICIWNCICVLSTAEGSEA